MDETKRVQDQSTDEWLQEYEKGAALAPAKTKPEEKSCSNLRLRFDHHRTAHSKSGPVILSFINIPTNQECVAFYNCDLRRQRGHKRGENYRVGIGGQFLPPQRGKFRTFYLDTVGGPPRRWAAVHKELKARFVNLIFTGEKCVSYHKDGKPFDKLNNVRILEE